MPEVGVPIGPVGTTQQVRNITANVLINGVLTPVLMQVVGLADPNTGNLLDMNIAKRLDQCCLIFQDIRKELLIQNEMLAMMLAQTPPVSPVIDLDKEYRNNPQYDFPGI